MAYKHLLGNPNLLICLDAGGFSKDTMSITSSLRGCLNFDLRVKIAENNMHSGLSGGVAPNPYHILTSIFNKICNPETQIVNPAFHVDIPEHRQKENRYIVSKLKMYSKSFEFIPTLKSLTAHHGSQEEEAY